ncbi:pectinesterase family protein [Prolixibacteraceae bacterium Z1-6]|uniref:Pectinesterase family protein n=1 Tax=Draconibacterium aestuarii TaxID=2998507 RepID=A0A9X3F9U5_9BACT|nr:pectinesterase family protein [Prolixibacteraceae bacterium Z1-6]
MIRSTVRFNSAKIYRKLFILGLLLVSSFMTFAQTPAFPTAEGYGMWATGGRGGKVVAVTNLEDDTDGTIEGSFRWALKQYSNEPLTIVFRVSGVINLVTQLRSSRTRGLTIAGQTAPGDGICVRGAKCNFGGSKNLVIRHLRFRIGLKELENDSTEFIEGGSIGIENGSNWIIDHCTFGWSGEENMTIYDNTLTTVQWCLVHEGLYDAGHGKGQRGYGSQWGGQTCTYHHNLLANNYNRTPRFNGARSNDINVLSDYVNNVNYNWGKENSAYGGDLDHSGQSHHCNMINNYYKPGPARPGTKSSYFVQSSFHSEQTTSKIAKWYMSGNYMEGVANADKNEDNTIGLDAHYYEDKGIDKSELIATEPFEVPYDLKIETAQEAYESVLSGVGAFPRDTVGRRIIYEVTNGVATYGGSLGEGLGIIDKPSDVGGYPEYNTYDTITDADNDGMDDEWETTNGLDPTDPDDRNKKTQSGYTCLEVYLNSLVGEDIDLDFTISVLKVHDFVVAKDGTGDFTTINEAIEAASEDLARTTIFIKKGVYEEKVFVGSEYQSTDKVVSLIGENVDSVIITWDDYVGKEITYPGKGTITAGGTTCPTMTVTSPGFYMENITIKNPYTDAQAVALYQSRDGQVIKNCKILGNQDTHRTKKGRRYFYFRSDIEGGVDFIYAGGTCYFYQCNLISNRSGHITAPEDVPYIATLSSGKTLRYGFVFKDCDILAADDIANGSVYLGRPWQPECGSVFLNCRLGDHINSKGWDEWGGNESSASFAEYKSVNADGSELVDVSGRADWSMQLTTSDVNNNLLLSKIYRKVSSSAFDPVSMVVAPAAPGWQHLDGNYLYWKVIDDAVGYVIYANGSAIGFNTLAHFTDTLTYDTTPGYTIRSVGPHGNLSVESGETQDFSEESITEAIDSPIVVVGINEKLDKKQFVPKIENGTIYFDQPVRCRVFSITGQEIIQKNYISSFNMDVLKSGVYVFWISDDKNINYSFKVNKL